MGNKIKQNTTIILSSLLLTINFLLVFSGVNFFNKDIVIITLCFVLFISFFFTIKKNVFALNYILFVATMPIITIVITLWVDTYFFNNAIINKLLKLLSWGFYQGETRSRYITKAISNIVTPILLFVYTTISITAYYSNNKKQ